MNDVKRFLDAFQYDNALTLAEILFAENDSEENLVTLAEVHLRRREFKMAHALLRGASHPRCRYLRAVACLHLGTFYEAEEALLKGDGGVSSGAAGMHLLGVVCQRSHRPEVAATYYRKALQMDPLSFESFTALCELGLVEDADKTLGDPTKYVRVPARRKKGGRKNTNSFDFSGDSKASSNAPPSTRQKAPQGDRRRSSSGAGDTSTPSFLSGAHSSAQQATSAASDHAPPSSEWGRKSTNRQQQGAEFGTPSLVPSGGGGGGSMSNSSAAGVAGLLNFDSASTNRGGDSGCGGGLSVDDSSTDIHELVAPPKALNFDTPQSHEKSHTPVVVGGGGGGCVGNHSGGEAPPTHFSGSTSALKFSLPASATSEHQPQPPTSAHSASTSLAAAASVAPPTPTRASTTPQSSGVSGRLLFHSTGEKPAKLFKVCESSSRDDPASTQSPAGNTESVSARQSSGADLSSPREPTTDHNLLPPSEPKEGAPNNQSHDNRHDRRVLPTPPQSTRRGGGGGSGGGGNGEEEGDDDDEYGEYGEEEEGRCEQEQSVRAMALSVLGRYGRAHWHVSEHRGTDALTSLHTLPHHHFATAHAQHLVGRSYFEMANYEKARQALELMARLSPFRMAGLELLSTTLWQLNKKVELSYLAQRVVAFPEGRASPQAWCAVGNCFSLQKEHEAALKVFQRAIQVDPEFTYAYTLCGYEYVANEDFEKAIALFRKAIQTSSRHFNAWYGLGSIYVRQEKFELAEYHFRKALSINPQNPVLYVHLGNVLHKTHKCEDALEMLAVAQKKAPHNPQVRYTRAEVLESLAAASSSDLPAQRKWYQEALVELEAVHREVPREAQVAFKLGAVCKKLGRKEAALRYLTLAYDLDPKDNSQIKNALERLEQPDLEEDSF